MIKVARTRAPASRFNIKLDRAENEGFAVTVRAPAGPSLRKTYLVSASLVAVLAVGSTPKIAVAQSTNAPAQSAQAPAIEEVVVTATRIVRDGYEAPTPTTVIGTEQIEAAAQTNITDYVNQLPSLAGSATLRTGNGGTSGGGGGVSSSNLRGLGSNRTLVLLDGHRVVGATFNLSPDVGEFPQALISRVDVVTGGASAAWGSDAVSGVVNFVLDKKYVGFKGEVSGGVTTYGDNRQAKITLTSGSVFGGGRGHFLLSGEHVNSDGVGQINGRPWYDAVKAPGYTIATTPAGQPQYTVTNHVGTDNVLPGGLVTSGPLKGIAFGPGGVPFNFNYGTFDANPLHVNGDWKYSDLGGLTTIEDPQRKDTLFARVSYDLTDETSIWLEGNYGDVSSRYFSAANFSRSFTIKADNAFLPAAVAAAMTANKLTSITVGNWLSDMGVLHPINRRTMKRLAFGADGKAEAFGTQWSWAVYLTRGVNYISNIVENASITANINRATDAVRNPATGAIVCRSTLTTPNDGCVPFNAMGLGVNSQAALRYSAGRPELHTKQTQDVGSVSANGEPFESWAGPVSLALGVEYRKESAIGSNEGPISEANGYFAGNFHATQGSYYDWEGFAEVVVPLAKDTAWARSMELNAAVRATDYSLAGYVTTWKVGVTYQPIDELRFRGTRSRDIRAPNLSDLFLAGQTNTQSVIDDFAPNAGRTFTVQRHTFGNTASLTPEKADTLGLGVVIQPSFFRGFSASFDYYSIKINGAIATPGNQIIMDYCYQGNTSLCQYIHRNAQGIVTDIDGVPVNIASQDARGFDIESSYRTALDDIVSGWEGNITLRALGTHIISNKTDQFNVVHENAGENSGSSITWRWLVSASYDADPITVNLSFRTYSGGVINTDYIECTSGCPVSTALHPTINNNHIPGTSYLDVGFSYKLMHAADQGVDTDVYFKVDNVTNKEPAQFASVGGNAQLVTGVNPSIYDVVGRSFRLGVRFKM